MNADDGILLQHLTTILNIETEGVNIYRASLNEHERRQYRVALSHKEVFERLHQAVMMQKDAVDEMLLCPAPEVLVSYRHILWAFHRNMLLMGLLSKEETSDMIHSFLLELYESHVANPEVKRLMIIFYTYAVVNVESAPRHNVFSNQILDITET